MIRFGVHCSLKNGLSSSLDEAKKLGCESIQLFTRSPRMWKMKEHPKDEIERFRDKKKKYSIYPVVVHTPYLPNLATSKEKLYRLSKDALFSDLEIAKKIDADYLVIHPGSFSEGKDSAYGISRILEAVNEMIEKVPDKCKVLFENVAGGGRRIGSSFEELSKLVGGVNNKKRVGICFDTAHALAAGFDIRSHSAFKSVLDEFSKKVGLEYLKVIHFNDSLVPLGSRKDRHTHLGKGFVGNDGFKAVVSLLKTVADAGILETPKASEISDAENLKYIFNIRKQSMS